MGDIDEDPYSVPIALLLSSVPTPDADDCAPGLETEPVDAWPHRVRGDVLRGFGAVAGIPVCVLMGCDYDVDRPSPGDDITHAALDGMDRE